MKLTFDGRFAYSGSTPHYAPDRTFNARHVRLELALDFPSYTLSGTCTQTLEAIEDPAQTVVFDAVHFKISRVTAKGKPVRYDYDQRRLTVHLPTPVKRGDKVDVAITYKVTKPKLGLHFVGPDRSYPTKPLQAWTQGEDEYNRFWFPCHDAPQERATTEMIITVPESFTAVSNGALVRNTKSGRKRTFHYKQNIPHSMYLVSLAVGEFVEIRDQWKNIPVQYFVPAGREEDAKRAFGKTPAMMEFFSSKLVPYAYAKYSQVAAVDFIYGGMENTSSTTQTALTLHDARAHQDFSSDPLVAHELAHQWFGDLVTCRDWSHAWLNESFATYFEALFKENDLGYDEFINEMRGNSDAYFDEDANRYRRPMVTRHYKNTNDLFDRHLYEKGSCILHAIRSLLGDDAWWRSMKLYLTRHQTKSVETVDLIQAIQDATGKNLRWFFDQWIYKGGHPELKVRFWWNAKEKKLHMRVLQTHTTNEETGLFKLPLSFAFLYDGKWKRMTETIEKKDQLLSFALPQAPELVLMDPDHAFLLKKVDIVKPESMWILQLSEDPHVLGRIDAAKALTGVTSPAATQALRQALFREKFWAVQAEIALALGRNGSMSALEALLEGLRQIPHLKTRRAIYEALGNYPTPRVQDVILKTFETENSWLTEAEGLRTLGRMKDPSMLSVFKEHLKRESWNDVIRIAALDGIGMLQLPESIAILKEYTRYGNHPNARMAAIRRLATFGRGRDDIQDYLIKLLSDDYLLVRLSVVRALGACGDERATEALMTYTTGDFDGRLKRTAEEAIRKIRKGMDEEFPKGK